MTAERADISLPVRYSGLDDILKRVPVSVVWEITLACDLACQHCGSRAGRRRRDELTTAEALDLVDQIAELGARSVGLIGGEAYLRKDWLQIIAAIRAAGMECDLQTGGRNLSDERVGQAAAAGLNAVGISIDGIGATHDRLRGVIGSFEMALEARAQRPRAWPRTRHQHADQRADAARIARADGDHHRLRAATIGSSRSPPRWAMPPIIPRCCSSRGRCWTCLPLLAELAVEGRERGLFLQPASNIGYFGPHESALRNVMNEEIHFHGCNAGDTVMGIEADGTIKSCPGLPSPYAGGNIRERRLRDIWENAEPIAFNRRRTVDDLWGYCRTCYYAETCLAGCTWTAHALDGARGQQPDVPSPCARFRPRGACANGWSR